MKNVLLITSSLRGTESYSTKVANELVDRLTAESPDATVKIRDLALAPPPALDASNLGALFAASGEGLSDGQVDLLARSDEYIAELLEADAIVIATGMINFGVPSVLKSWLDLVLRAGITFRYTESGPEGLVAGKKAYLVLASGGVYSSGPMQPMDHLAPYLIGTLGFIGINDVQTVRIEGVAFGPEAAEAAYAGARTEAAQLALAS